MSMAEIIPAVHALSRSEKLQLAHLLLDDLAKEELPVFQEGQVYPIYTPEYAPTLRQNSPNSSGRKGPVMSAVEQFPYCDRNPASGGLDLMPDLPIVLRHQTHSCRPWRLVDSGASISVLPYSLGVRLGFDWNTQKAAHHACWNSGSCCCTWHRGRGVRRTTGASASRSGLGQFGSGSVSSRTVQLLPVVRCLLFPHAEGLRDQATGRCEFSVKINGG